MLILLIACTEKPGPREAVPDLDLPTGYFSVREEPGDTLWPSPPFGSGVLGASVLRSAFDEDTQDWSALEDAITANEGEGMDTIVTLADRHRAADISALGSEAGEVAAEFGDRVAGYIVWDHANIADATALGSATCDVGTALDAVSSAAMVVAPGFVFTGASAADTEAGLAEAIAGGAGACADAFLLGSVVSAAEPPEKAQPWLGTVRQALSDADLLEAPLWYSDEWSGGDTDMLSDTDSGAALARSLLTRWDWGVDRYLVPGLGPIVGALSLTEDDGSENEGALGVRTARTWMDGAKVRSCEPDEDTGTLWTCIRVGSDGVPSPIVWSTNGQVDVPVPDGAIEVQLLDGTSSALSGASTWSVDGSPVWFPVG